MEAGGTDREEETLQTAFKKLRVDAESLPGAVSVSEALVVPRVGPESSATAAKPKLGSSKDNWHGCTRKTTRGASRSQRRRRSKSPILHPPKFTYCNGAAAPSLSPPSGRLKHQRLAVPESAEPGNGTQSELPLPGVSTLASTPVFGASAGYRLAVGALPTASVSSGWDEGPPGASGAECPQSEGSGPGEAVHDSPRATDSSSSFQALSELQSSPHPPCSCTRRDGAGPDAAEAPAEEGPRAPCPHCSSRPPHLGWQQLEVYSFTGLRDVISECERSLPSAEDGRTLGTASARGSTSSPATSGSPRSCSEQARVYVDDITIEDLSGYMEYYLYIPKKMSHMAEMMYT